MINGEALNGLSLYGLFNNQLIFPTNSTAFRSSEIREQVKYLVKKYGSIQRIEWVSPMVCHAVLSDGVKLVTNFTQLAQQTNKRKTRSEHLVTAQTPERPKIKRRTIPHVSQGGPTPGASKEKAKINGPGSRRTTIKALVPAKSMTTSRLSKPEKPVVTSKSSGQSVFVESVIELAFARGREERERDGSRQWSGYRDGGTGQFGSYPTFDPSDDSE
jgi:hypothetical protein